VCKNHDNAPAHTALSVREFLATKQITVLEPPAYSPDLASNDFFLFLKINEILKGRHFDDIDDISSNTTAVLNAIPQNQFQNCFEGWTRRWHRCIASQGEYFEGWTRRWHRCIASQGEYFEGWTRRWHRCIASQGEYFEGDHGGSQQ